VLACLDPGAVARGVARFARAAAVPVEDVTALLRRARPHTPEDELTGHWHRAGDRSVWGLINAATQLAHRVSDLSARLQRERDAERILAVAFASHRSAPQSGRLARAAAE
jgi:hypothetical protein